MVPLAFGISPVVWRLGFFAPNTGLISPGMLQEKLSYDCPPYFVVSFVSAYRKKTLCWCVTKTILSEVFPQGLSYCIGLKNIYFYICSPRICGMRYCGHNILDSSFPAGTATLWQRCYNVVVDDVTTLWHCRKWELYRRQFPTLRQGCSPRLSKRCHNVATTSPQH